MKKIRFRRKKHQRKTSKKTLKVVAESFFSAQGMATAAELAANFDLPVAEVREFLRTSNFHRSAGKWGLAHPDDCSDSSDV